MRKLSLLALMVVATSVAAEDSLPEVRSLMPERYPLMSQPKSQSVQTQQVERLSEQQAYNDSYEYDNSPTQEQSYEEQPLDSTQALLMQWFKRVNNLQKQVQELTGKIEEQEYKLTQLEARHDQDLAKLVQLQSKISEAKQSDDRHIVAAQDVPLEQPYDAFEFSKPTSSPSVTDAEMYQSSYQSLQIKDYQQATAGFKKLLTQHPHSQFVPNAHYWLGEIYLLQDNYPKAEEAFTTVKDKYPEHAKAADALLKLGYTAIQQEQWAKAKDYLQQVKQKYPNTVAARLADNRLQQLGNDGV